MDRVTFQQRQETLSERLRHAVPRSGRAKALREELRALVVEQLRDELGGQAPVSPPAPPPEPPADFRRRVGDGVVAHVAASAAEPSSHVRRWWIDV